MWYNITTSARGLFLCVRFWTRKNTEVMRHPKRDASVLSGGRYTDPNLV